MKQQALIDSLPPHLRQFVTVQDYASYTARDHAVWRFLMYLLTDELADRAHAVYLDGLARAGISKEHIPDLDEMNRHLAEIGWQALGVDGFIPPAIFMEFQSRRILVIAMNMRTADQLLYTPAPDILHESAGHAPFLVDVDYSEFLQAFGEIGMYALTTAADEATFEAVRHLSIVKEDPAATKADIDAAELTLQNLAAQTAKASEATLLARLHWWTVEYGLVGSLSDYRIFGAGLLSSLGESRHCFDDTKVAKKLLTPDAINQAYDITTEQPHLYVTHSCRHLSQVLHDVARGLAQARGGASSVREAIGAATVATMEYSSGLTVSGPVSRLLTDAADNITYVGTNGPTQLAFQGKELLGHGKEYHAAGFGSPVGYVNELRRCLSEYTIDELRFAGIEIGRRVTLEFVSGIIVTGQLDHIERAEHHNVLLSFSDCTVIATDGETLFDPAWGQYDMAVGVRIDSVRGGVADPSTYPLHSLPAERSRPRARDPADEVLFRMYQEVRESRLSGQPTRPDLVEQALTNYPQEWLLLVELAETVQGPVREKLTVHLTSVVPEGEIAALVARRLTLPSL